MGHWHMGIRKERRLKSYYLVMACRFFVVTTLYGSIAVAIYLLSIRDELCAPAYDHGLFRLEEAGAWVNELETFTESEFQEHIRSGHVVVLYFRPTFSVDTLIADSMLASSNKFHALLADCDAKLMVYSSDDGKLPIVPEFTGISGSYRPLLIVVSNHQVKKFAVWMCKQERRFGLRASL